VLDVVDRTVMTLGLNSLIVPAAFVEEVVVVVLELWAEAKPAVARRPAKMTALEYFLVIFFIIRNVEHFMGRRNGV